MQGLSGLRSPTGEPSESTPDACDECGHSLGDGPEDRAESVRIDGLCNVCAVSLWLRENEHRVGEHTE